MSVANDEAQYPSLKDRVVLITGGSRGIGRTMALALAQGGARVAITGSRASDSLDRSLEELRAIAGPDRAIAIVANVIDQAACQAAVDETLATFGAIHVLVNNAGLGMGIISQDYPTDPVRFWEADPAESRRMVDTNVNGAFNMALAVTPLLVAQGFGKIVNISTSTVTLTLKGFAPYGPSKAALEAASLIWAKDLAGTCVDVNIFLPGGATDTDIIPPHPGREERGGGIMPASVMAPGILWFCADESNGATGGRYVARLWDVSLPPAEAAAGAKGEVWQ
jgi:3-oxoacyl-[acyl-carrier protein] reductase